MVNNKTIKFISALLIVLIVLPSVLLSIPERARAQLPVTDVANTNVSTINSIGNWISKAFHAIGVPSTVVNTSLHLKDFANFLLRQILMTIAKSVLARITQATINWINSDFHGSPLFIENPESFFRDIAKSEIRRLVDMIGYDTFRFPFGPQTALNVISSYKSQLAYNAQYSLSKVINDPRLLVRFRNDFNYGGWNGFLINTQYPQNNYLGFNMIIQQNLASRLEGTLMAPAQKIQSLLQQSMGFLSPQICPSNPNYNNGINEFLKPSFKFNDKTWDAANPQPAVTDDKGIDAYNNKYNADKEAARAAWSNPTGPNVCPGGLVSTTPGTVVGNQIMDALGSNLRQTELGAALGNSLSAIFDALINNFLNKGLNALASTVNPSASENNNWSYNGSVTLNSSTTLSGATTAGGDGVLNIPQNVSVRVQQGTSTNISGGKAPYYIIQSDASKTKAIATIDVSNSSGPKLVITALNTPTTTPVTVTVYDSSIPAKTVTVSVTVNEIGALLANGATHLLNMSIGVSQSKTVTISGGAGNYSMKTGPDETKAVVAFSDTSLVIIGVASGSTYVEINDSSNPVKTVRIEIIVIGPKDLTIPQNVSVRVGQTINVPIAGGVKPYSIKEELNTAMITSKIVDDILQITGLTEGQSAILIKDSSSAAIVSTNITITSPVSLSVGVGQTINTLITGGAYGGVAPYTIKTPSQLDTNVATATITGLKLDIITVTGVAYGTTKVVVKDSSPSPTILTIPITVNGY
ncbi:MAG: hypothetical protein AAB595_00810 [Patescibacteria group bacterium]